MQNTKTFDWGSPKGVPTTDLSNGKLSGVEKNVDRLARLTVLVSTWVIAQTTGGTGIAVLSTLCVGTSLLIARKTGRLFVFRRVTIATFWYVSYLAMIFFPAFWVFADQEGPYRGRYLFAVESVLISVPLGWWVANAYLRYRKTEVDRYFRAPLDAASPAPVLVLRFEIILLVAIGLTALYLSEVRTIPLFYALRNPGEYLQVALLREDSFKLLNSRFFYFYYVLRQFLYPALILIALGYYLRTRERKWLGLFIVSVLAGMFYNSLTMAKAPVAFIVMLVAIFGYLYRGGIVKRSFIAAMLLLTLAFPVAVLVSVAPSAEDASVQQALKAVGYRLFYLPSEIVYYYFEVFPSHVSYLHGRSVDKLATVLGLGYFDTTRYVGRYGYPTGLETVNANGAFIGDLNADFGLWGVLFGGVLAGFLMQAMHIHLLRSKKTVPNVASYAFLTLAFWYLHSSSLPIVLASNGAVLVLVLKYFLENRRDTTSRLPSAITSSVVGGA